VRHAFVVHGTGSVTQAGPVQPTPVQSMDELSIAGLSQVAEVRNGEIFLNERFSHADFGIPSAPIESLRGGDAEQNAQILRALFAGAPGPHRDVVVLNTGAILAAADLAPDIAHGIQLAQKAIDSGAVTALVAELAASNINSNP